MRDRKGRVCAKFVCVFCCLGGSNLFSLVFCDLDVCMSVFETTAAPTTQTTTILTSSLNHPPHRTQRPQRSPHRCPRNQFPPVGKQPWPVRCASVRTDDIIMFEPVFAQSPFLSLLNRNCPTTYPSLPPSHRVGTPAHLAQHDGPTAHSNASGYDTSATSAPSSNASARQLLLPREPKRFDWWPTYKSRLSTRWSSRKQTVLPLLNSHTVCVPLRRASSPPVVDPQCFSFSYAIKGAPNQKLLLEDIYYAIESRVSLFYPTLPPQTMTSPPLVPLFSNGSPWLEGEHSTSRHFLCTVLNLPQLEFCSPQPLSEPMLREGSSTPHRSGQGFLLDSQR